MNTTVSIIIPTYNRAHLICETLDSVIAQTYTNWECIIVDDGSTDTTVEIVAKYCKKDNRFQYYQRPQDRLKGGNAARNFGYEQSKGAYIQWFDSDDVMLENYLKDRVSEFTAEIDFVICGGYSTDNNLKNYNTRLVYQTDNLFKAYVVGNLRLLTQSVIFKKGFLEGKELFSEKLLRGQETELFSRLFFKILPSRYIIINASLFLYRIHDTTKSSQNKKKYISDFHKSMFFVLLSIMNKGLEIGDKKIINHYYRAVMDSYFIAIYENDVDTINFMFRKIILTLLKNNLYITSIFLINYISFFTIKRNIYYLEIIMKNKKIKQI